MPELPEVETIARGLARRITGATIARVEVRRPDVLRGLGAQRHAVRRAGEALVGRPIRAVTRRAKAVVLETPPWRVVVTPRFTGGLFVRAPRAGDDPFDCVRLELTDGRTVAYRDVRRLGTVAVLDQAQWEAWTSRLGLEPLDVPDLVERLSALLRDTRRAVKVVLMDQARVAGIGNIYASEVLWTAGVDPSRAARSLHTVEVGAIAAAIRDVLERSVLAGGTSIRDYRDATGSRGAFTSQLAVYGRAGEPCLRCGRRIVRTSAIDGRSTYLCAACQK